MLTGSTGGRCKRATSGYSTSCWIYKNSERRRDELPFLGAKGTTGTQASFLALFLGRSCKGESGLDAAVAKKMDFDRVFPVTGQTYSRKIDTQVL